MGFDAWPEDRVVPVGRPVGVVNGIMVEDITEVEAGREMLRITHT